jgi:hypothetical protein
MTVKRVTSMVGAAQKGEKCSHEPLRQQHSVDDAELLEQRKLSILKIGGRVSFCRVLLVTIHPILWAVSEKFISAGAAECS